MLKLTKMVYTDKTGKELVVDIPPAFQVQLPCSSHEGALLATGALIAKGFSGVKTVLPGKEE